MFRNFLSSLTLYTIAIVVGIIILCINIRNTVYKAIISLTDIGDYLMYPLSILLIVIIIIFSISLMSYNTAEYIVEFKKQYQ